MTEFQPWPKIPRWNRGVVVTEKIDGTNAAIVIEPVAEGDYGIGTEETTLAAVPTTIGGLFTVVTVHAQSRSRLLAPGTGRDAGKDNYGFAAWVKENAGALVDLLGPGRHFGEWYGQGIARGYGLDHKRFALFNVHRWSDDTRGYDGHEYQLAPGLPVDVVPTLATIQAHALVSTLDETLDDLRVHGSYLAKEFDRPEGVILYHTAAKQLFKVLIEGDDLPKGVTTRAERSSWGVYDA